MRMFFVAVVFLLVPCVCFAQDVLVRKPKVLVVFYSRDGHTKLVAEKLAAKFEWDIEGLVDLKKRTGPAGTAAAGKDALSHRTTNEA